LSLVAFCLVAAFAVAAFALGAADARSKGGGGSDSSQGKQSATARKDKPKTSVKFPPEKSVQKAGGAPKGSFRP